MKKILILMGVFALQNIFAADTNSVLTNWFAAQAKVKAWSADFTQIRTFKALVQPLKTPGKIFYSAPNEFRWELGQPARTVAVRHGDEMFVIYPALKRAERYPLGANAPQQLRDTLSLLQAGLPRSQREFDSQFQIVSLVETNGNWQMSLQPKSRGAREMLSELKIILATNNFSLVSTTLVFADSSMMENDYTNAVINPSLDQNIFEWKPPVDYKVTEPAKR